MALAEQFGMMSSRLDDAQKPTLRSCMKGNTRLRHEADRLNIHLQGALVGEAEAEEMEFRNAALVYWLNAAD
jgi:hypothetical protein